MDSWWDVLYWQGDAEAKVMHAFLEWQGKNPSLSECGEVVLKATKGLGKPIARLNGEVVAIGLIELIKYFEDNGLMRLA